MENVTLTTGSILAKNLNSVKFSLLLIICLATVILNLFILLSIFLYKSMRNYLNYQFASIAFADLIVGLIAMPSLLIPTLYDYWPFGRGLCILWCISDFFGCNVSSLSLVMISLYRLKCIKKPFMKKSIERKLQIMSLAVIWIVPFICWTISIIVIQLRTDSYLYMNPNQCYFMYSFTYVMIADTLSYLLPAIVLILIQFMIFFSIKNHTKRVEPIIMPKNYTVFIIRMNQEVVGPVINNDNRAVVYQNDINRPQKKNISLGKKSVRMVQNEKAFRALMLISTVYMILWTPWIIIWPIQAYCGCAPNWFYETTYWMQYCNSLSNPIALIAGHSTFRESIFKLLKICNIMPKIRKGISKLNSFRNIS